MTVVVRFAPSPTGFLHIGGARTALFNWLFARHHGGIFRLRIEDTDRSRSTPEAVATIIDGLEWLGLSWDDEIVYQSARAERHAEIARQLLAAGRAYYCYCTPAELQAMREKARAERRSARYDGTWRDRDPAEAPPGTSPVIRLKAPQQGSTTIRDLVQGVVTVANSELDDLIILRADGTPTYNLSVVVDDHDMDVTHVIRGDDHLNNAFRQTQIYHALDWPIPEFAHVPLIYGPDGTKMSKRHGAVGIDAYRDLGYLPEALRNYLLRLGWSHGDDEIISTKQAIAWFDLDAVGRAPARFDFAKLDNLNAHYVRIAEDDRLVDMVAERLEKMSGHPLSEAYRARLLRAMPELKLRPKTLPELAANALFLVKPRPIHVDEKAARLLAPDARHRLAVLLEGLAGTVWQAAALERCIREFAAENGVKLASVAQPLRAALTGSTASPGIFEVMEVLGREETLGRIADAGSHVDQLIRGFANRGREAYFPGESGNGPRAQDRGRSMDGNNMVTGTMTLTDNETGKSVELPVLGGTIGPRVIDIRKLYTQTGHFTYDPGFMATAACRSSITYIDGDEGILLYRGYPIEELAEKSDFLEVAYLLLNGELPTAKEKQQFVYDITHHTMVHEQLTTFFRGFRRDAHPMAVLCGVVGALSAFYHDLTDIHDPYQRMVASYRLIAKMPTIAAMAFKYSLGQPFIYPQNSLSYAENFLHMAWAVPCEEYKVNPVLARAMDRIFILHADHEQNASTATVRNAGSSGANPFACIAAGIASLWGPAHGGANEAVLKMLARIGDKSGIKEFISQVKDKHNHEILFGFGHRVYHNYDPRAHILRDSCHEVLDELGIKNEPLLDLAMELEKIALNDDYFITRKLYPNVDFYSGIILRAMGFPTSMFTVLFAIARTVGWVAQWTEMIEDPDSKIGRPRQLFTGSALRHYVPVERRA